MDGHVIQEIKGHATPYYLYDLKELRRQTDAIRRSLDDRIELCYAMKANPFLVSHMASLVDRIEVCSYGEYLICNRQEIPKEKLVISGVLKKPRELQHILQECGNKPLYTAESEMQYRLIEEWCYEHHTPVNVILRLTSGNQFGMDEAAIEKLIAEEPREAGSAPVIYGLHYFSGTQKSEKKTMKEIGHLMTFIQHMEATYDIQIRHLEFGPGLKMDYFLDKKPSPDPMDTLDMLSRELIQLPEHCELTIEMGRAFAATCGYYVTQVMDQKTNEEIHYAIVDGGMHQLQYDGQIRGMYEPHITHIPKEEASSQEEAAISWTICGSLCTVNDVLCQGKEMKNLQPGDYLVFARAGAYGVTEGMALFLSHELPAVYTCDGENPWKCLRTHIETCSMNTEQ